MGLVKICTKCGRALPLDRFTTAKGYKYGRYSKCKECCAKESKEYYAKNKNKVCTYKREWRHQTEAYEVLKAEELLGGWRIYVLNHIKEGESKYTAVKVATADVYRTNDKKEFLGYLEREI